MAQPIELDEHSHEAAAADRTSFGFWIYLMTDLLMFAVLFAVYMVLRSGGGGPSGRELFSLPLALTETLILLTSSFVCGLGMVALKAGHKRQVMAWFSVTFILGLVFLSLELNEFRELIHEGHALNTNSFLSSFFILVGTHGLHIVAGLVWMATTLIFIWRRGLISSLERKLNLLSLYWHFLDIVWIFIFTIVYLGTFV